MLAPAICALLTASALAACTATAPAQQVPRDSAGFPLPDRPVAEIVSPMWAAEEQRDARGEARQVIQAMGIGPGMSVADIGAGTGYFVVRLSPVVGPSGRVLANDIMPDYLAELDARVRGLGLANVSLIRGEPDDAKLPPASVDVALFIHMYHEIEQPYGLLHRLAASMKPGGRIGIVDLPAPPERHGTPPDLLRCELAAVGYRQISFQMLQNDDAYLAIFAPPAPGDLPAPTAILPCAL